MSAVPPGVSQDPVHVLVVDDDARLRTLLSRYLVENGFRVSTAAGAAEARDKLRFLQPDALVLDVMMPGESGLALTSALRADNAAVPILLLTARGAPEDRIAGFESGADDYLGKPFEPRELVLRLRAMLRRAGAAAEPASTPRPVGPLRLGPLEFDTQRAELSGPDGVIYLTGGEAALLAALANRPNEVFSREEIAAALSMDDTGERAVDVQVTRLRRKIEADPREPRFLHTVRGRGYVLKPGV
jgi:two-component system phosphate regulon response regulator OmpR